MHSKCESVGDAVPSTPLTYALHSLHPYPAYPSGPSYTYTCPRTQVTSACPHTPLHPGHLCVPTHAPAPRSPLRAHTCFSTNTLLVKPYTNTLLVKPYTSRAVVVIILILINLLYCCGLRWLHPPALCITRHHTHGCQRPVDPALSPEQRRVSLLTGEQWVDRYGRVKVFSTSACKSSTCPKAMPEGHATQNMYLAGLPSCSWR